MNTVVRFLRYEFPTGFLSSTEVTELKAKFFHILDAEKASVFQIPDGMRGRIDFSLVRNDFLPINLFEDISIVFRPSANHPDLFAGYIICRFSRDFLLIFVFVFAFVGFQLSIGPISLFVAGLFLCFWFAVILVFMSRFQTHSERIAEMLVPGASAREINR